MASTLSRLIALDKFPGFRPIGIREVLRRIIGKAIPPIICVDIQDVFGINQLCVGQKYSCEAAIHALDEISEIETTEGVLMIDALNAFNNLNHQATLRNVQQICPALANTLINTYCMVGNFCEAYISRFRDLTEFTKVYPMILLISQYKGIIPACKS